MKNMNNQTDERRLWGCGHWTVGCLNSPHQAGNYAIPTALVGHQLLLTTGNRPVFIQGGGPRNKAVAADEFINDRRGAARIRVTLSEYRRLATLPDFPPYWTDLEGRPYRLVGDLDAYAIKRGLITQPDLFGEVEND